MRSPAVLGFAQRGVCQTGLMERASGRNVVIGLVLTTGRIGATTGRLVVLPARVIARSPLARAVTVRATRGQRAAGSSGSAGCLRSRRRATHVLSDGAEIDYAEVISGR